MKIKLKNQDSEPSITLVAELEGGELKISDDTNDWAVAAFRIIDGKLNLVRYTGIDDNNYNTNKEGQIVEVDE